MEKKLFIASLLTFLSIFIFSFFLMPDTQSFSECKDTIIYLQEEDTSETEIQKNVSEPEDTSKIIQQENFEEEKNQNLLDEEEKDKSPENKVIPLRDSMYFAAEEIINKVNELSMYIDNVHAEAEISIKTAKIDEEGNIEIKAKKNIDEFWFRIWGSFAFISKDAFFGHFTRNNFLYYNNLNNYSIQGPTTDTNIGYVVRVRASFDDMMNAMTGTVRIPVYDEDTVIMKTDNTYYTIMFKSPRYKRQYWVKKSDYSVTKYEYYNNKMQSILRLEFYNFMKLGMGSYARNITIYRPLNRDELKLSFSSYLTNQSYLDFKIDIPYDCKRKVWK